MPQLLRLSSEHTIDEPLRGSLLLLLLLFSFIYPIIAGSTLVLRSGVKAGGASSAATTSATSTNAAGAVSVVSPSVPTPTIQVGGSIDARLDFDYDEDEDEDNDLDDKAAFYRSVDSTNLRARRTPSGSFLVSSRRVDACVARREFRPTFIQVAC